MHLDKFSAQGNVFVLRKRRLFLFIQSHPIKKSFSQHTEILISHRTQTNVQQPFSNTACYCELAVQQPVFETSQSCVSTTATLSYRFKSSPSISGKFVIFCTAGYLMNAGHFRKNHVSSGDLNRGRRTESRVLFGYFLHNAKSDKSFSLAGSFEVLRTSNQPTQTRTSH